MHKVFSNFYDKMMDYVDYDSWIKFINERISTSKSIEKVLEIGVGTGEILSRLSKQYQVEGLEISDEMINITSEKFPNLNVKKLNVLELREVNRYDVVIAIFDVLNYLKSLEELGTCFKNVESSLTSGGVFLFDVLNRKMINNMFKDQIFADDRDEMTILWKHNYNEISCLDEIETSFFVKENDIYRRYDEFYEKMIFRNQDILEIGKENGLILVSKEINVEIAGPRVIYVFRKE